MIKYSLVCKTGHAFESWFQNAAGCETQIKRGQVLCPECNTSDVGKAIMAPAVTVNRRDPAAATLPVATATPPASPTGAAPVALVDDRHRELRSMIRALHERIVADTENVGKNFPEEARKINDGVAPERPIRGEATLEEARALLDEGIGVLPLPVLPDELN